MRWVEVERPETKRISRATATKVLRAAVATAPDPLPLLERLGAALMDEGGHREAIAAFDARAKADPARFTSWGRLAQCHNEIGEPATALAICDRAGGHGARVARARGAALEALGRRDEALESYRRAFGEDETDAIALDAVLRLLCRAADAAPLLAFCDALPATARFDVQKRAFRALACSRLGRREEASALIDPERHVMSFRFDPACESGGVDAFNARLAGWLLANTGATPTPRRDCVHDYALRHMRAPLLQELRAFFRQSFDAYIAALPALGLDRLMPPPVAGDIADGATFLRNEARNGEHVHRGRYLTGVYYVHTPQAIRTNVERRGRLAVGRCHETAGGHEPVWGARYIAPEPGMFVVFPAHMFHDVVPTRCSEWRIAIVADVEPAPIGGRELPMRYVQERA
ncbi:MULTISPECIES: putative 2OG-Fe(II) oxygenase [Methylosinus]|uniref:Tetratricopeptide repeat protein n=1 Tax=Methylosinus trichosporium (strain ATCC 35070 / NCIMB 11131 / UNIQEM 75 / OB3b) TaxID=595536 RepID=A0A2D2D5L4_METT3|nr:MULTISPECIES: putative 2OG-Fe(II) oxygenase [Methylosinus]ATQ70263.1 hypothetical protein CQW49_06635 [Methylosinus trichosporium OB3b]